MKFGNDFFTTVPCSAFSGTVSIQPNFRYFNSMFRFVYCNFCRLLQCTNLPLSPSSPSLFFEAPINLKPSVAHPVHKTPRASWGGFVIWLARWPNSDEHFFRPRWCCFQVFQPQYDDFDYDVCRPPIERSPTSHYFPLANLLI